MYNTPDGARHKFPAPQKGAPMNPQNKKDLIAAYKRRTQTGGVYAVTNTVTGKSLVLASADIDGIKKRYEFAEMTGGCFHPKLQKDAQTLGNGAFAFSVLETLDRKDTQTDREFMDDLDVLLSMWLEKYDPANLY
jgi:hypothetical protein